jgi:hypothetical protein
MRHEFKKEIVGSSQKEAFDLYNHINLKKGEKKYGRWLAGWRESDKVRKVYLGSCRKMSQAEALEKARRMKADALGIYILQ